MFGSFVSNCGSVVYVKLSSCIDKEDFFWLLVISCSG